jgi:hypothetical protein
MKTINRGGLIVRPRTPYLEWVAGMRDTAAEAVATFADRFAVYLVREDPDEESETAPLEDFYEKVFELELEACCVNEDYWPENRTLAMFLEWFDVQGESLVIYLGDEELEVEEL